MPSVLTDVNRADGSPPLPSAHDFVEIVLQFTKFHRCMLPTHAILREIRFRRNGERLKFV